MKNVHAGPYAFLLLSAIVTGLLAGLLLVIPAAVDFFRQTGEINPSSGDSGFGMVFVWLAGAGFIVLMVCAPLIIAAIFALMPLMSFASYTYLRRKTHVHKGDLVLTLIIPTILLQVGLILPLNLTNPTSIHEWTDAGVGNFTWVALIPYAICVMIAARWVCKTLPKTPSQHTPSN